MTIDPVEVGILYGMHPGTLTPERRAEIEAALGGRPEQLAMSFACYCERRLRVFDALHRAQAHACAQAAGWHFNPTTKTPGCPSCPDVPRFGGYGSDGSNHRGIVPSMGGKTETEQWIFIGAMDRDKLLGRAAESACAIISHVLRWGFPAPEQLAETHLVVMRMLEGRAEFWVPNG